MSTGPVTSAPGGQQLAERILDPAVQHGDVQAGVGAGVGGQHPDPAGVGHDGDAAAAGTGWLASRAAVSRSSPMSRVAMMPACANSASRVTSGEAAAAVCEAAARCPAAERPACTVRTGMWAPTWRAVWPNLRGLPNDSRYSTASLVAGS